MFKLLKNRKLNIEESDKKLILNLRQMYICNEQQKTLQFITEDEYMRVLSNIDSILTGLEDKYINV